VYNAYYFKRVGTGRSSWLKYSLSEACCFHCHMFKTAVNGK